MSRVVFSMLLIALFSQACLVANETERYVNGRVYDCAANSLYILCKLDKKEISYEKCLEYLPLTNNGNNMLEFKKALEDIGYIVGSKMIDPKELRNIKVPCVVLRDAFDENGQKKNRMGHFFVIVPRFESKEIVIYDYPARAQVVHVELLIASLEEKKIIQFPILLCGKEELSNRQVSKSTQAENSEQKQNGNNIVLVKDTSLNRFVAQVDFGELPEGSQYKGCFKIKNISKEKLLLKYLEADCKCAGITCDKKLLQSGDEAEICMKVSLVQKYNSVTINGYAIFEHDDGQIVVQLLIKGISQPRWICKPQKIDFGNVNLEEPQITKRLILEKTPYGKESKITGIEADSSFLLIEKNISDDGNCILDVKLEPDRISGVFSGKINIYLNNENKPATYFDVSGIVKKEFIAVPEQIVLKAGETQRMELYHCDEDAFSAKYNLEPNDGDITVKQLPSSPNKLNLLLDASNLSIVGIHRAVLLIQVNQNGKIHNVSVPVICVGI